MNRKVAFINLRTKQKILVTLVFYLFWIVTGTFGFLPSPFFNSYLGRSHSIFAPLAALADVGIYIFLTHVLVLSIFWVYDRLVRPN